MSEMMERVARAICKERGFDPDVVEMVVTREGPPVRMSVVEQTLDEARAAIKAMREPTEAMVDAMMAVSAPLCRDELVCNHQRMIDAALK